MGLRGQWCSFNVVYAAMKINANPHIKYSLKYTFIK